MLLLHQDSVTTILQLVGRRMYMVKEFLHTKRTLRVWLYYRLSRDEDVELNSLNNQREILVDFVDSKGYDIVGESFDDNVSGMHFEREGIHKLCEAVDKGLIDAVIVKDLSRHNNSYGLLQR